MPPEKLPYIKLRIWLRNKMADFEGPLKTEIPRHIKNWDSIPEGNRSEIIYWLKRFSNDKN